jgi:flagellin
MRINTNVAALSAHRNLSKTGVGLNKSIERLSSGLRINRAGDDAAGLVISQKLRAEASGLRQSVRNAQDGISFIQTAEGALDEVSGMLNRMRDLAVQAKNGTQDSNSRAAIVAEYDQLQSAIGDIYDDTKFAGANVFSVFDGTGADVSTLALTITNNDTNNAKSFQVGNSEGNTVTVDGGALTRLELTNLNFDDDYDPVTASAQVNGAGGAVATDTVGTTAATIATDGNLLTNLDTAISMVSEARGTLGASQNRLESTVRNLSVTAENLSAAESRIRDVDVAEEMMSFTRSQILQQAGTAMLAQANGVSQGALQLLG